MPIIFDAFPARLSLLAAASLAALLSGCGSGHRTEAVAERNPAACTDFYAHANQAWIGSTPVPPDNESIDITTGVVADNQVALLQNLTTLAASASADGASADQRALVDLFASRADTAAVEAAGLAPLAEDIALIDRMTDTARLPATWGLLLRRGVQLPVALRVEVFDDAETSDPAVRFDRLRVALETAAPARQPDDEQPTFSQADFQAHIARTLALTGMPLPEADDAATAVVAIEQALAGLAAGAGDTAGPALALTELLGAAGVPRALPLRIDDAASRGIGGLLPAFSAEQWRGFTRWRVARSYTDYLPAAFAAERATWDAPAPPVTVEQTLPVDPRLVFLARLLPRQLDLFFAERVLPADTGAQATAIARQVRAALHRHLDSRAWLGAASRATSHRLLETLEVVVPGVVDTGPAGPFEVPAMRREALLDNVRAAAAYDLDRRLGVALASRTGRGLAGDAWSRFEARYNFVSHAVILGPATVQALLAGDASQAARYGTLGTVVAHEMLHMFGAPGDLLFTPRQPIAWLDTADRPHFERMVVRLENDYAAWATARFQENVIRPRFMGEDLSDLGSVPVALSALQAADADPATEDTFYRAFAFSLRTRRSDAEDRSYLTTVPAHAIYNYRVNGPLSNLASFAARYGCVAGDGMVRGAPERVDLW